MVNKVNKLLSKYWKRQEKKVSNISIDIPINKLYRKLKYTIDDIKKFAKEKDGKCLSKEYINAHTKLKWRCNKDGYIWDASWNSVQQNSWCPKCARNIKYTIEDIQKIAKEKNIICLSKIYKNKEEKLKWKCNKDGYEWEATLGMVINKNRGCPLCGGSLPLNIKHAYNLAEEMNGVCLSTIYKNNRQKLKWKCNICNNTWWARYDNISMGKWCPHCRIGNKSEGIFRQIIELRTGLKWPKSYPKWLKKGKTGPRELDMYNRDLKIAIEYNDHKEKFGYQTEESFKTQKENDIIKINRCKKNNINIIWVPLLDLYEIDNYVKKICQENNIKIINNNKITYIKNFGGIVEI